MKKRILRLALMLGLFASTSVVQAGNDRTDLTGNGTQYTGFSNINSIVNTRHNLTQGSMATRAGGAGVMNPYRNDYGEVCVYCHTPHGANTNASAPLWNRNMPATTYTTYDKLGTATLTQTVYQPGAASLPCLSCHDGQQAVDAIINMPGAGRYNANPGGAGDLTSRWTGGGGSVADDHFGLKALSQGEDTCLSCHSPGRTSAAVDFTVFAIGTDLRNDHPVGVKFPTVTGSGTDWNTPNGSKAIGSLTTKYFDENGNGRMDKGDIRLYDTGNGPSVECASCHDPHGVTGGNGKFNPTFLRKTNSASAVCLTCHSK